MDTVQVAIYSTNLNNIIPGILGDCGEESLSGTLMLRIIVEI